MSPLLTDRDLLARLVAIDSTSRRSNLPLAEVIADYADGPGVSVVRNPSPDGTKVNLVITKHARDRRPDRAGLVLSGHMDTVPADEPDWRSDPFRLTDGDERYVGRGACDMKGFLALALNAFRACPQPLDHPLVLLFTYDEEVGTLGSRRFVETWTGDPLPARAVIGEPTDLRPVRMHKGHLKLRITTEGRAAHSGLPHLGVNAIEPAARAIGALERLRRRWEADPPPEGAPFDPVPFVALNVARVRGGTAVNVVPDRCAVDVGIRTLPGTDTSVLVDQIRSALRDALGDGGFVLTTLGESPPMALDAGRDIVEAVRTVVGGRGDGDRGAPFATDAGWLQRLGMDCVLCGPGSMDVAHRANEHVPIDQMRRGADLLRRLIASYCRRAESRDAQPDR